MIKLQFFFLIIFAKIIAHISFDYQCIAFVLGQIVAHFLLNSCSKVAHFLPDFCTCVAHRQAFFLRDDFRFFPGALAPAILDAEKKTTTLPRYVRLLTHKMNARLCELTKRYQQFSMMDFR